MTPAAPPAFPGGRVLAGWGRQLDPLRPQALWLGLLLLHHVEALVRTSRPRPLDPLAATTLKALSLWPHSTTSEMDRRLHLGAATGGILLRLQADGLAEHLPDGWVMSPAGLRALEQNEYPRSHQERRSFHFLESGRVGDESPYLRLRAHQACIPWRPEGDWRFHPETLKTCVGRPIEWKRRREFPVEVADVLVLDAPAGTASWERVVLDRPEGLWAVLVQTTGEGGGDRLLGFAVRPDGWALQADEPAFVLHADWRDVLPQLAEPLAPDTWRHAWMSWCQAHHLPAPEATACSLQHHGARITVAAGPRLLERLRSSRSEALRGEAWLLAGDGLIRAVAQVELTEDTAVSASS